MVWTGFASMVYEQLAAGRAAKSICALFVARGAQESE